MTRAITGPPLTPAQAEVLPLLAEGLTGLEIAARLYRSPGTVKSHLIEIRSRRGARNAAQVIALAYQHGYLPTDACAHGELIAAARGWAAGLGLKRGASFTATEPVARLLRAVGALPAKPEEATDG